MIADKRTGLPMVSKGIFGPDESLPIIQKPALSGWGRNGVISGKCSPQGYPLYLDTNYINRHKPPTGQWFVADLDRDGDANPKAINSSYLNMLINNVIPAVNGVSLGGCGSWVGYGQPGIPKKATRYGFVTKIGYTPRTWRFEGANAITGPWTTLHGETYIDTWTEGMIHVKRDIPLENQDFFQYWRLIVDEFDVSTCSIYALFVFQGEPEDDGKVFIDASPEYPLVLSFADGYSGGDPVNHIVTVTERRELYIEQALRDAAIWHPKLFAMDEGSIIATYNPTTGDVSFSSGSSLLIPPSPDALAGDTDWKMINNSGYSTSFPIKNAFDVNVSTYYRASDDGWARIGRRDECPFWFNKVFSSMWVSSSYENRIYCRGSHPSLLNPVPHLTTSPLEEVKFCVDGKGVQYGGAGVFSYYGQNTFGLSVLWGLGEPIVADQFRLYLQDYTANFREVNFGQDIGQALYYNPYDGKMHQRDFATGGDSEVLKMKIGTGFACDWWIGEKSYALMDALIDNFYTLRWVEHTPLSIGSVDRVLDQAARTGAQYYEETETMGANYKRLIMIWAP